MLEPTIKYRSAPAQARVPEWHSCKALRTANPSYISSFTEGTFKLHLTLVVSSQFWNVHDFLWRTERRRMEMTNEAKGENGGRRSSWKRTAQQK